MTELKDRLNAALQHADKSRGQLATELDCTEAAIGAVMRGTTKQMAGDNLVRAARYLGVNAYWLATGEENMLGDDISPEAREVAQRLDKLTGLDRRRALAMCRLAVFSPIPEDLDF